LIIFAFLFITQATDEREFLEGFLSGFQETEVEIGEDCLNPTYVQKVSLNVKAIVEALYHKSYLKAGIIIKTFLAEAEHELDSCHYHEVVGIFSTISEEGPRTLLFRLYTNFEFIEANIMKMATATNVHEAGEHFGKALRYFIEDNPNPALININKLYDLSVGFFTRIGETCKNPSCVSSLNEVPSSITLAGSSLNGVIKGDQNLNSLAIKVALVVLDLKKVNGNCDLTDFKAKIAKLFTSDGLTQATIRYGMNIKKINAKKSELAKAYSILDYKQAGSLYADLLKILLNWQLN